MKAHLATSIIVLSFVAGGCTQNDIPVDPPGEFISDVGESVDVDERVLFEVYRYEGVAFNGDLAISEYRKIQELVGPELQASETLFSIDNYETRGGGIRRFGEDITVKSCTKLLAKACTGGNVWGIKAEGEMEVVVRGQWDY